MEILYTSDFWLALMQIIWIDILLGGDNAVVIALASRSLPPEQQRKAILFGSMAAIIMRIILTIFAFKLLSFPYLKIIGSFFLIWIGIQLLLPQAESHETNFKESNNLITAIKTILFADLIMSIDNVVAIAAASKGNIVLLILGLSISIPLIIFSSKLILRLMERFPIIITLGGALLGFIAGEMAVTDPAIKNWVDTQMHGLHDYKIAPIIGALIVLIIGKWLARRSATQPSSKLVDLMNDEKPKSLKE